MRISERLALLALIVALGGACAPLGGRCVPCAGSSDPDPVLCPSDDLCFCRAGVECNYGSARRDAGPPGDPCCVLPDGGPFGSITTCTGGPATSVCAFSFGACGGGRCVVGDVGACSADEGEVDAGL